MGSTLFWVTDGIDDVHVGALDGFTVKGKVGCVGAGTGEGGFGLMGVSNNDTR